MRLSTREYHSEICLMTILAAGIVGVFQCSKENSTEPPPPPTIAINNWKKHTGNPVLDTGNSGEWDDAGAAVGAVLYDGSTFKMWYVGNNGSISRTGYATSTDGIHWAKYPSNPVLDVGPEGSWDETRANATAVLFDGTAYHMWYFGERGGQESTWCIGYATSADGITWTKHPSNPILKEGSGWEDYKVWNPTVIYSGTQYKMWYTGYGDQRVPLIGYATSSDGVKWTKYHFNPVLNAGSADSWDARGVFNPFVLIAETTYRMWYTGWASRVMRIGYATSSDAVNWQKYAHNPVLGVGPSGSWDAKWVEIPRIVFDGSKYHMWYHGLDANGTRRTGYATSQ